MILIEVLTLHWWWYGIIDHYINILIQINGSLHTYAPCAVIYLGTDRDKLQRRAAHPESIRSG